MSEPAIGELLHGDGFDDARRRLGRFNLAIFGMTGAGKSSLVNAVFGLELARTGIGEPVTEGSKLYRHTSSQLGVYDTRGLEIGSDNAELLRQLRSFIVGNRIGGIADQIHVIWYCIRAGDRRIQPAERAFIEQVATLGIPVLLVITRTPKAPDGSIHADARALAAAIETMGLPLWGRPHLINALGDDFDGIAPFGLDELLADTAAAAPSGVRSALAAAQVISLQQKRLQVHSLIGAAERQLRGKAILPDVGRVWSRLFAEIAAVYQLSDREAREVLDRVRTAQQLRALVRRLDNGLVVLAAGALASLGLPVEGLSVAYPEVRDVPLRAGEIGDIPIAVVQEALSPKEQQDLKIGPLLAAGPVTAGLGDAWRETCEYFWQQSFPEPPSGLNSQEVADRFAEELFDRLPQRLRRWAQSADAGTIEGGTA